MSSRSNRQRSPVTLKIGQHSVLCYAGTGWEVFPHEESKEAPDLLLVRHPYQRIRQAYLESQSSIPLKQWLLSTPPDPLPLPSFPPEKQIRVEYASKDLASLGIRLSVPLPPTPDLKLCMSSTTYVNRHYLAELSIYE